MFITERGYADEKKYAVSVGAATWYAWWDPIFRQSLVAEEKGSGIRKPGKVVYSTFSMMDSSFLYGPVLNVQFTDRWSMAGVFQFSVHGGYSASSRYVNFLGLNYFPASPLDLQSYYVTIRLNRINRYDADLSFNYHLTDFLKLYLGLKYQGYTYDGKFNIVLMRQSEAHPFPANDVTGSQNAGGVGAGFAVNVRLVAGLFIIGNLSFTSLVGSVRIYQIDKVTHTVLLYGGNGSMSLSYYFERIRTAFSLGYRSQVYRSHTIKGGFRPDNDIFHGPMFSVVHTF